MTASVHDSPLGKASAYIDQYRPELLFSIARAPQRRQLGLPGDELPFVGMDLWTAYELSWLNPRGKPQVAMARILIPAQSSHIVESKSFKLYLNSFNGTRLDSAADVQTRISQDISAAIWAGGPVQASASVQLIEPENFAQETLSELDGLSLDRLDIDCAPAREPASEWLRADTSLAPVEETLCSQLLKSNCPVTGQPDWASVQIRYTGAPIDQAGLLRYLISFRTHNDFHEHCVERIFTDIQQRCRPLKLSVYARYTRRGGLDINPWRTSHPGPMPSLARTPRQ